MGMPQFMPSSFNKYAIDMDGDGIKDLRGSPADVIGSVAHYLAEFGWRRDLPTRFDVAVPVDTADRAALRLARLGRRVKLMLGGMTGWADEGFAFAEGAG